MELYILHYNCMNAWQNHSNKNCAKICRVALWLSCFTVDESLPTMKLIARSQPGAPGDHIISLNLTFQRWPVTDLLLLRECLQNPDLKLVIFWTKKYTYGYGIQIH